MASEQNVIQEIYLLRSLDFDPDITCEARVHRCDKKAEWRLVHSCGDRFLLCGWHAAKSNAAHHTTDHAIMCSRCFEYVTMVSLTKI